jgi:hypothetical protein
MRIIMYISDHQAWSDYYSIIDLQHYTVTLTVTASDYDKAVTTKL